MKDLTPLPFPLPFERPDPSAFRAFREAAASAGTLSWTALMLWPAIRVPDARECPVWSFVVVDL